MDAIEGWGYGLIVQILLSALIFAFFHIVFGFFAKDWGFVIPVFISTFVLGILLPLVYIASARIALPVVIAHIVINLIIEPGLIYNAIRESTEQES